ncbi:MAG: VPLPA-CTERM sorting domain-containing protein [Pseudomonadota bacterium]
MNKGFFLALTSATSLLFGMSSAHAASVTYDLLLTPTHAAIHNAQVIESDAMPASVRAHCTTNEGEWDCYNETIALNASGSAFGYVETPSLTGQLTITDGADFSCDIAILSICADGFDMAAVPDPENYHVSLNTSNFQISFYDGYDTAEWLFPNRAAWWRSGYIDTTDPNRSFDGLPADWPGDWDAFGLDLRGQIDIGFEYEVEITATTLASAPLPASLLLILGGLGGLGLLTRRRTPI